MKRILNKSVLALLLLCLVPEISHAQQLKRAGWLGARFTELNDSIAVALNLPKKQGLLVQEALPNSTAAALKLQPNDVLTEVNGKPINVYEDLFPALGSWQSGDLVQLTIYRNGKQQKLKGKAVSKPLEKSTTADILYESVPFMGGQLRSIINKPKGKTGKLPAILFIQGYTCGSMDNGGQGPYGKLVSGWAERGYVVMRLEKPGVGDSQGTPGCDQTDLYTETRAFEAGLLKLKQYDYVDTANIFIFGHSMGGVIAPLLAEKHQPRGVMVFGTVFKPWFEFLLGMYRFQYPKMGTDFVATEAKVRGMQKVLFYFFVEKKSPAQIIQEHPELKALVEEELEYKGTDVMWTRPYKFWQQLDEINLAQSWKNTRSHVLAIQAEHDFESYDAFEHKYISELVNSYRPGNARYLELPKTNHMFVKIPATEPSSTRNRSYNDQNFNYDLVEETDKWMKEKMRK